MKDIDKKDLRLLYALEKNARTPVTQLAKEIAVSPQVADYKIRRLEKKGIILGYHAIIDTARLGYITYRVYLKLRHADYEEQDKLFRELSTISQVSLATVLTGMWSGGIVIMAKDSQEFHKAWSRVMEYKEQIAAHQLSIYSPIIHYTRTLIIPDNKEQPGIRVLGEGDLVEHDELDVAILRKLAPNVRIPLKHIAKELDRPLQTVINRIKAMEQNGIIQGYRPELNWEKLGYDYFKANISLTSYRRIKEMEEYALQEPHIFQLDKTGAGYDFEIEIYAKDMAHFKELMNAFYHRFSDCIESWDEFRISHLIKEEFMPAE